MVRAKNLGYFVGHKDMTSFFSNSRVGNAPPPTGAHVSVFCQGSNLHLIKFQHTREIDQNLADPLTLFLSRKIDLAEQLK